MNESDESDFEMYNLKRKKRSCKSYKGSEDKLIIITSNQNKEELDHSAFLKTKKQISTLSKKKKNTLSFELFHHSVNGDKSP